ncbi:glycosyl hydrolase family 28-related protein [Aurantiacibacter spongiae]|uniref:glycosyl hydrolase family 28-related protein n=1 Tax=Aurantiacibacter spongiae TaxID=2488860 RepID=UPI0013150862|nr:glycosyl hydrolase family 28-related protein [Aurantiacibacter spongiae]
MAGAFVLTMPGVAFAQQVRDTLPEILSHAAVGDAPYLPDFSYAGYGYGLKAIPAVNAVIDVGDYGAIPDDGRDDSKAIKAALAAAHEMDGPVRVQFGAGRYVLTEILWIERNGIVLAGMGSGQGGTQLYMPRPLDQADDGGALDELREYLAQYDKRQRDEDINLDTLFSEWSWSGGFIWTRYPGGRHATYLESYDRPIETVATIRSGTRGTREVRLGDPGSLAAGDVVQIHWHNRAGEDGPLITELYGDSDLEIGDRHWTLPDRPLVRQATRIESIEGDRATIADPLLHDIDSDLPAYFARWDHLSEVGIQDLAMVFPENPYFGHHNEAGYNGIYFTGVHDGWISNVRIVNADSGILTDDLANVTIADVVTTGDHKAHYGVHMGNVHNVLVTGNEVRNPTEHTFSFNTQSTRSVYHRSTGWEQPTLDQHAGANHQNLYDALTVHVRPRPDESDGRATYDLFKAGGAGYWQPGHGRYNTVWNLDVEVESGAQPGEPVIITENSGGPEARIVGLHGNRPLILEYDPAPYVEATGQRLAAASSLYDWQLSQR